MLVFLLFLLLLCPGIVANIDRQIVRAILLLDGCELLKMAIETLISNADAFFAMAFLPDAVDLVYERVRT